MTGAGEIEAIRLAHGRFTCMTTTYSLGVFNDNFYKQAALLLAVSAGRPEMQGYALAIFTLPFVLLAAPAGWMADRFSKRTVVIGAKWCELIAMLFGAVGICSGDWLLIFSMLAIMGIQATFFSPALNGSIPELYPAGYVPRANAILRIAVTFAILSGIALGGLALDIGGTGFYGFPQGRLAVAGGVIAVALLGLAISTGVPRRPAADPAVRFPWSGPVATFCKLWATRHDPLLALTIGASAFIWFMGSLQILLINPLGILQFGLSKTLTSYLIVAQMVGIGLGGLLGSFIANGQRWHRPLGPAAIIFSLLMIAVAGVPYMPPTMHQSALFILVAAVGISGGVFLIPVESFIQIRPAPEEKGAILAVNNFVVFTGVLLSGLISNIFNALCAPTLGFGLAGALSLAVSGWFHIMYKQKGDV
ncbi:MAG: MFS transporter [Deltaproteobacteria bacterium]|nr:MFS transporter [Deltaproteobacteria bacterium]